MSVYVKTQNHGTLNMRAQPSTSSAVVTTIPYGTELPAEKINDSWAKVTYNNKTGYVMTQFLSTEKPSTDGISKADIQKIYNSLKSCLKTIEDVLK